MTLVSCVIATFGDKRWQELAYSRAYPSTLGQGFYDVVVHHAATLADARNEGAEAAMGHVLVFLDADDELAPGYLDAMAPWLLPNIRTFGGEPVPRSAPPHLLVPSVSYVYPGGSYTPPAIPQRGLFPELNECVIGTAVSKEMFSDVGGFRELPSLEDYDLWLRCFDAGAKLAYVEDAVYRAHVTPGSRNLDQSPYQEIWQAHLDRIELGWGPLDRTEAR